MKRFAIVVAMVAMVGLLVSPVWASDVPPIEKLVNNYFEKRGEATPDITYFYLFNLVTNHYDIGWGSIFVLTNYDEDLRIQITAYVVPNGATPGQQIVEDIFLLPYEVKYVNLIDLGLGPENAWAILFSTNTFFGSGVLLYCTDPANPGIAWETGYNGSF
jgi:hypothetical protein